MPAYDKVGGDLYQRQGMFVDVGNTAYAVERAFVKIGGSLYEILNIGGGGIAYALMETGSSTGQTTLYSIDETTGVLTQVGAEQTIAGVNQISGIGTFTVGSTAYALMETGSSGQTTLYSIDETTGVLTQVGAEQTIAGVNQISGIGTFTVGSTAYALMETGSSGTGQTTLYSIAVTTGVLTQVGAEQTIAGVNTISGIGTFTVGSTAYALMETGSSGTGQTTLYSIAVTTGVLTQVGAEQTIAGVNQISGIGTFTVGSTAYALMETGSSQTTLYSIAVTTGVLTQVGAEQTIAGADTIGGIGTFTV